MRLARKLFLLVVMALAALTLIATTASAQLTVQEEHQDPGGNEPCPAAGCHFELETEHHVSLVAQTAGGPVTIGNCNVHLEGRADSSGVGTVTEMKLTPENPPTTPSCTRAACDNAAGVQTPWPIAVTEPAAGQEIVELTFCIRTIASGPGGPGTQCEVHMPLSDNGNHQYEIGDETTYTCENLPNISISEVHCINEVQGPGEAKEDVEIVH